MKLIIDIPENVIEGAKSSPNYYPTYHFEKIWRAIANGTPYNPSGDLISREALKETIELEEGIFWDSYAPNELIVRKKYIDNAPTVTQDCSEYKPIVPPVDLDREIELYKSKVAFYESQNTHGEYDVTARELKFVVETLEKLSSERTRGDLISREWLKDAFDNLCCHNCKICRNFRNEDSFYKCNLIENAPTIEPQKKGLLSIDDVISVFIDFMCDEVDGEGIAIFRKMLKNKAEKEGGAE